jgi:hypothetical protein
LTGEFITVSRLFTLLSIKTEKCYSKVRVGKYLANTFPIKDSLKQGDTILPLLFNFGLEYAIKMVQAKQEDLKLNGTHQFLVYANNVSILGGSIHTIKYNTEALVVATKEMCLEANAEKTKYMVMSRDQNAGQVTT